ncbi:purine-nucleoside phosphorylase [Chelativorans xinjiangense]|uniref:phosphorylase family protein n=1 Tax=Chelativorans xinjiangense TaxID=2681485 RepID=UPI00135CCE75|nr:purine-nucleoside phosphorylase [Chelativorans xinjiangense]
MKEAVDLLTKRLNGRAPRLALVLGSGLGGLVDEVADPVRIPYAELPGFPQSGVTGHAGTLVAGNLAGRPVIVLGRFVGMSEAYDAGLQTALEQAAGKAGVTLHKGVYMWFSGPNFETPAEIRMARTLGADAVGMSTVPEVILARFLGLKVAACSVITNLAAGMAAGELSHEETKDMAPVGGEKLAKLLARLMRDGPAEL